MLKVSQYLLYAYLLLKPYYLFSSGGLQIADGFLIASFLTLIIPFLTQQRYRLEVQKAISDNRLFAVFVIMTMIINGIYFGQFVEFKFILSSLYFVYNFVAIILFSIYLRNHQFLLRIDTIFKFNLLVQLTIFLLGLGSFYSDNRYMGTFNDPNQLGYYVLLSYAFIYLIKVALQHKRREWPFSLLALFLILLTASTGMFMAVAVFAVLRIIIEYRQILKLTAKRIIAGGLIICVIAVVVAIAYFYNDSVSHVALPDDSLVKTQVDYVASRIEMKTEGGSTGLGGIIEDRCIDRVLNYPQGLIYGVGEGNLGRFDSKACGGGEVHSTWIGILFYYGIIPFMVLMAWLVSNFKTMNRYAAIIIAALFIESFTLVNQRQSLFWAVIILASLISVMGRDIHKEDSKKGVK